MAYSTGTASSPGDLLVKFFDFLITQGWTVNQDISSAAQSPAYGHVQKVLSPESELALYCGFFFNSTNVAMYPSRGFSGGLTPSNQPNYCSPAATYSSLTNNHIRVTLGSGPYSAYHFFAGTKFVHAVVEISAGFFRHFGMGQGIKLGSFLGGEYYYGHYWEQATASVDDPNSNSHTFGPGDGRAGASLYYHGVMWGKQNDGSPFPELAGRQSPESQWHRLGSEGGAGRGVDSNGADCGGLRVWGIRGNPYMAFQGAGTSQFQGYKPLMPIYYQTYYTAGAPDTTRPLITIPEVRLISLDGLTPNDEISIAGDTWKVFPVARKTDTVPLDDVESSGQYGFAYKKVT